MITDVSLGLLYLIVDRFRSWLMLLVAAQRRPKTSSCSSYATRSQYCAEPTQGLACGAGEPGQPAAGVGGRGLLHPRADAVTPAVFAAGGFFLAADKVLAKYEMLAAHWPM